jgi:tRNA A37 threonylcarbamoyladenosine dehydratase
VTPGVTPGNTPGPTPGLTDPTFERRFGGLRRLYGEADWQRLCSLRVAVVGLGGVGSWAVEALARSGVASLVLIDFDHVAESNINRQVQALESTLGQAKGEALRARIAEIHPGCAVHVVDEFATPQNWPALLPCEVDAVIDACDQVSAKVALAAWALQQGVPLVVAGAAGGKLAPEAVQVADLSEATHDPLLASLRQRLRKFHGAAAHGRGPIGVRVVYSREAVRRPAEQACLPEALPVQAAPADDTLRPSPLACAGYGSSVMVTATFGMVAASEAVQAALERLRKATSTPTAPHAASTL